MRCRKVIALSILSLGVSACASPQPVRFLSYYGSTVNYLGNPYGPAPYHEGVDIAGTVGDEVIAATDGTVILVGLQAGHPERCGLGVYASVLGSGGYRIRYCHLSGVAVQTGDDIKRGQLIGYLGATGNAGPTPHLHYEIRLPWGATEDPLALTVGCFNSLETYPTDRVVLTYPVRCMAKR